MWRQTFPPVTAAPLNVDLKDPLPSKSFPRVGAWHVQCRLSPTTRVCCVFRCNTYVCKRETPLAVIAIFFCCCCSTAVMSGCALQMDLRLPLWSIMQCHSFQGLLMRSSASFGWKAWKFFYYFSFIFSSFFCLEGNAVFLIKPGSKPELNFSLWRAEQNDGTIKASADNYGISGISRCMSPVKKHIDIHTVIGSGPRLWTVN